MQSTREKLSQAENSLNEFTKQTNNTRSLLTELTIIVSAYQDIKTMNVLGHEVHKIDENITFATLSTFVADSEQALKNLLRIFHESQLTTETEKFKSDMAAYDENASRHTYIKNAKLRNHHADVTMLKLTDRYQDLGMGIDNLDEMIPPILVKEQFLTESLHKDEAAIEDKVATVIALTESAVQLNHLLDEKLVSLQHSLTALSDLQHIQLILHDHKHPMHSFVSGIETNDLQHRLADATQVKQLFDNKMHGRTALYYAVRAGHPKMVLIAVILQPDYQWDDSQKLIELASTQFTLSNDEKYKEIIDILKNDCNLSYEKIWKQKDNYADRVGLLMQDYFAPLIISQYFQNELIARILTIHWNRTAKNLEFAKRIKNFFENAPEEDKLDLDETSRSIKKFDKQIIKNNINDPHVFRAGGSFDRRWNFIKIKLGIIKVAKPSTEVPAPSDSIAIPLNEMKQEITVELNSLVSRQSIFSSSRDTNPDVQKEVSPPENKLENKV